jgi:hypothetical protein
MPEDKKPPVEISVERIGNKMVFQIDADAVSKPGSSCSSCSNKAVSLQELASAVTASQK